MKKSKYTIISVLILNYTLFCFILTVSSSSSSSSNNNVKNESWERKHRYERASLLWKEIISKMMVTYSKNTKKYDSKLIIKSLDELKRRIHHAVLIYNKKIHPTDKFYQSRIDDALISISTVFDSETPAILYTGLAPSESNLFDIRYLINYVTVGSDFFDFLFHRGTENIPGCKPHFPKLPSSENDCSFIMLNTLPPFEPIEDVCESMNNLFGWFKFLFFYLTNDRICLLMARSSTYSGLSIFLYKGGTEELPRSTGFCLILSIYWGVSLSLVVLNTLIFFAILSIASCCSCLFTGCISNALDVGNLNVKFTTFESDMNKSLMNDLDVIREKMKTNEDNIKKITKAIIESSKLNNKTFY